MPISFPTTGLVTNVTTYTYLGHTWLWNGTTWDSTGTIQGLQGTQGITGLQGTVGLQGNTGNAGTTIVTAKGDLIVGTASSTVTNQAIGGNYQTLIADSAVTNGLRWGDDLRLLDIMGANL
jgi:hypothetical protein